MRQDDYSPASWREPITFSLTDSAQCAVTPARAYILCAGRASRWDHPDGVPKHLVTVGDEILLDRTIRQLQSRGVTDIAVVSNDRRLHRPGCALLGPDRSRWAAETLQCTRQGWNGNAAIFLGDVYYSDRAMDTILRDRSSLAVFGRPGPSRITGSRWAEIFALRVRAGGVSRLAGAARRAVADAESGGRGKLWEIYRALTGQPLRGKRFRLDGAVFRVIDDLTDDVDTAEDWRNLEAAIQAVCSRSTATA